MPENIFVFVVCGAREHIETLHFSLRYLRKYSAHQIWVLTDLKRNETEIVHEHVIHADTPEKYDHHEASIYLKTGIHRFLPKGNHYCYLDTDVIALAPEADAIFNEFIAPIRFAPDHCRMNKFSPSAVRCGCSEQWETKRSSFMQLLEKYNRLKTDPEILAKRARLEAYFENVRASVIRKTLSSIRYHLSGKQFWLNDEFYFDKQARAWKDTSGQVIIYESDIREIARESGYIYDEAKQDWKDEHGHYVWEEVCNHLKEKIYQAFGIAIQDGTWQHWNGGVFLFNDSSHPFLEAWHTKTMHIFGLSDWKTRDQGTLIATVWEFGLQDHPVLDKRWNFLADYNNEAIHFDPNGQFTDDDWAHAFQVNLLHVYHHFGDASWDLWNYVLNRCP